MSQSSPQPVTEPKAQPEPTINCRQCGHLITRAKHKTEVEGQWEFTFRNPAGYSFHLQCYRQASGCLTAGHPTARDSWFPGCAWSLALCSGCQQHLGWHFSGQEHFWGLIATRLCGN